MGYVNPFDEPEEGELINDLQPKVGRNPTPEQIERRAAAIRAGWTKRERIQRMRSDLRPQRWHIPEPGAGADELFGN